MLAAIQASIPLHNKFFIKVSRFSLCLLNTQAWVPVAIDVINRNGKMHWQYKAEIIPSIVKNAGDLFVASNCFLESVDVTIPCAVPFSESSDPRKNDHGFEVNLLFGFLCTSEFHGELAMCYDLNIYYSMYTCNYSYNYSYNYYSNYICF